MKDFFTYIKRKYPEILNSEMLLQFIFSELQEYYENNPVKHIKISNTGVIKYNKKQKNSYISFKKSKKINLNKKFILDYIIKQKFIIHQLDFNENCDIKNVLLNNESNDTILLDSDFNLNSLL